MSELSKATYEEQTITKGIKGHEELTIYLGRSLFSIDMFRFDVPHELVVKAVELVDKFGETEGIAYNPLQFRRTSRKELSISFRGDYKSPATPKDIEKLYDGLCEILGR